MKNPVVLFLCSSLLLIQSTASYSQSFCYKADKLMLEFKYMDAIEALDTCYQSLDRDYDYWNRAGYCYYKLGNYADAKSAFDHVLEIEPGDIPALNQLAQIASREENEEQALKLNLQLIEIDSTNSIYYKRVASLLVKSSQIPEAIEFYRFALFLNPRDLETINDLSRIYQALKMYDIADSLVTKGARIDPSNRTLRRNEIQLAYYRKDYEKTSDLALTYLEETSDSTLFLLKIYGVSLLKTQSYSTSLKVLRRAYLEQKESEALCFYLGQAYHFNGQADSSKVFYERAIENGMSSKLPLYFTHLGSQHEEQSEWRSSIAAYRQAYTYSKDPLLLYRLARNYDRFYKDKSTALLYYETYLASGDSANPEYLEYSGERVQTLKEVMHFQEGVSR